MPAFIREVYRANFEYDFDISSREVITHCLQNVGQPPEGILLAAESVDAKQQLRKQTERAQQLDIFGAPTLLVGDELFWGNDRLETAIEWAVGKPDN